MRGISKLLFIFLVLFGTHGIFIQPAFADAELLTKIETQITPDSTVVNIQKLQTLFLQLGLYSGTIDGEYASIEQDLLSYQIKSGVIVNKDSYGAWYFGKKTIEALKADFPETFADVAAKSIPRETVDVWERTFIVTAYYSPLLGQAKYVTWSYARDIRLNWNGTNGASGKWVHPGFLAAPKNYDFGTKIHFEGLWVWVVEDRGWAIVNAGKRWYEHDRIDIWMGYGDEGRIRAVKWGKRTVKWEILSDDADVTIEFSNSPINKYLDLKINADAPKKENVKRLQELFIEIWKYNGQVDGEFTDIKEILVDFQVKKSIISSSSSEDAGYFWPKTLTALREDYESSIDFNDDSKIVERNIVELSKKRQDKLDTMIETIEAYLLKKTWWDTEQYEKLADKLSTRILKAAAKQTKPVRKLQLEYIANNL